MVVTTSTLATRPPCAATRPPARRSVSSPHAGQVRAEQAAAAVAAAGVGGGRGWGQWGRACLSFLQWLSCITEHIAPVKHASGWLLLPTAHIMHQTAAHRSPVHSPALQAASAVPPWSSPTRSKRLAAWLVQLLSRRLLAGAPALLPAQPRLRPAPAEAAQSPRRRPWRQRRACKRRRPCARGRGGRRRCLGASRAVACPAASRAALEAH